MKTSNKRITVQIAYSCAELEEKGCSDSQECDTIKEARERAKYFLTVEYQRSCEASEPFNYARIVVYDGPYYARTETIHSEYWRVGYSEPQTITEGEH